MQAILQFVFIVVLTLCALVAFAIILVGGWIVGTLYLWIDGPADDRVPFNDRNRGNKQ